MKNFRRLVTSLLPVLFLLTLLAGYSNAALLDVGPTVPQVIPSSPPQHGYPLWYRDQNRVPLELCLSSAISPNAPGSTMCNLLPGAAFNPALPISFPGNFPDEAFWYSADAVINNGFIRASMILALEAAWSTGAVTPGNQISFARIRYVVDTPAAGTYRIIHPYGEKTFVNVPAGTHAIFDTEDIGVEVGKFDGALKGGVGPFLRWDTGPVNVNGELFLGDPNVDHAITGSPLGTNFVRIEGPPGSNLDGLGNNFVQTNLFAVTGKIYQQPIPTPMTADKAVYARDAAGAQVSVFTTSQPVANTTNSFAPFPGNFALLGTLSNLQTSGAGIPTVTMTTNDAPDGKFFSATGYFVDPGIIPATIRVTNTADIPPSFKDVPLVDEITVSEAIYRPLTKTLTIKAASSDGVAPPALQAFMPGMAAPLGTLTAGQLIVNFPVTDSSVTPSNVYEIPPLTVTVRSALGGVLTVPVVVQDQVDLPPTGSIVINGGAAITASNLATLTLTATDDSGIVAEMQFSRDGLTWLAWEPFNTTRTVNLTVVPGDGLKTIYVRFKDGAGNISLIYSDSITLDATGPTGTISINNGAVYTRTATATLTISATDPNGVASMQFSHNGVNWFAFEPYATTRNVNLATIPGDGTKTIYVRFKDSLGNVSQAVSDTIILDTTPPTGTVTINNGAAFTRSTSATLALTGSDASGAAIQMQFSKDGVSYFAFEPFAATRTVTLLSGDGLKTIYVRFKDAAGNVSLPVTDTITLDTTAPAGTILVTSANPTTSATGTLALTATDNVGGSGVTKMQFSTNNGVSFFAAEPFKATRPVSLPVVGVNNFTVRFIDAAGNISGNQSVSITRTP